MKYQSQYGVMGNPIAHSKSPLIFRLFNQQCKIEKPYEAILVPVMRFTDAIISFQQFGGLGLNVTLPFKQQAFLLMDELGPYAKQAGAVNTIVFKSDDTRWGENTDGIGFLRDLLHNQNGKIEGKRVLVIGAGGGARGILGPVLNEKPASVVLTNRTVSKAETIAQDFSSIGEICVKSYLDINKQEYDLIINATSASLLDTLPPLPNSLLRTRPWCYDMAYSEQSTPFLIWARQNGATRCIDGLGMLVEQAAESFYLWHNLRPQTREIIHRVRARTQTSYSTLVI